MPCEAAIMVAEVAFSYAKAEQDQVHDSVDTNELSNKKHGTNKAEEAKYLTLNKKLRNTTLKFV